MRSNVPTVACSIRGVPAPPLQSLKVEQKTGLVDQVTLVSKNFYEASPYTEGAPVVVDWGTPTWPFTLNRSTFVGTIASTDLGSVDGKIIAMGPGWSLKDEKQRVFNDATIPQVVQSICDERRIAAVIDTHPTVWGQLTQNGSDLAFINELADRIGFIAVWDNTTLRFVDRDRQVSRAPVFDVVNRVELRTNAATSLGEYKRRARRLGTVDALTGNAYTLQSGEGFISVLSSDAANLAEAEAELKGEEKRNAYYVSARADATGIAPVKPGVLVNVQTLSPQARKGVSKWQPNIRQASNGLWFVDEVVHEVDITGRSYTMKLGLLRSDTTSVTSSAQLSRPVPKPPAPVFLQSRWVASHA